MTERSEHIAWCKKRALEYVDLNDLSGAVASMVSDMAKRDDCTVNPYLTMAGMIDVQSGNARGVRNWIEGFQ